MNAPGPLRLPVIAGEPQDLFEEGTFPFRGPVLNESVRDHLLLRVREARTVPVVELEVRFERDLRAFYTGAAEEAEAEVRVNHIEARHTFMLGLIGSAIALAVAIPVRLYLGFDFYIIEFLCIVVVWILMWDSIEKLLWDSMLLRMRSTATRKLRDAAVRFVE